MQAPPTSAGLPERAVERLFARFTAMYGQGAMKRMWLDMPLAEVKSVWADSLSRFTMPELLAGLRYLEDAGSTFPPTLPEFVAACRRKPEPTPAAHRPLLAPPPRTPEEIAAGHALAQRIAAQVSSGPRRDPAASAYRVIERYRSGDKVVSHAAYKGAIEALENLGREVPA
jgi:hypothetical protein